MDLAELEAQLAQMETIERQAQELLAIQETKAAEIEAKAFADNMDAQNRDPAPRFYANSLSDIGIDYPNLPRDRIAEIGAARRGVDEAGKHLRRVTQEREAIQRLYEEARDQAFKEEVAELKAGSVHWDRRFHTSLAIGHGAAFAAIVNHVFDKDTSAVAIKAALPSIVIFGVGLLLAGAIPWVRAVQPDGMSMVKTLSVAQLSRRKADRLAKWAALLFAAGVVAAIGGAVCMAFLASQAPKKAEQANPALAAQTTARSPPIAPSAPAAISPPPSRPGEIPAPPPRKSKPKGAAAVPEMAGKGDHG